MKNIIFIFLLSLISLNGCAIYKLDVQQGNAVSQEAVAQLRPGMSKAEVQSLLGTPLLQDDFHQDRWDYVFYVNKAGNIQEKNDLVLTFNQGRLASIKK